MADDNQIGAKIVLEGDASNARAAIQGTTADLKQVGGAAHGASGGFVQIADAAAAAGQRADGGLAQLKGSLVQLASSVPGVSGSMGAFGAVAEAVAAGPLAAVAVGVGAVTSAFGIAGKALDAFEGKQDRVAKLDAALAAQGELTDAYREKLQRLAGEYGRATGQGGQWLEVLTRLTQHGAQSDDIERYAEGVKNLAGILGGNTERASMIFGRVLEGNTAVLRRFGIEVDKTQSQAEQMDNLFAQLAERGGGQLAATTNTLSGQFHQLSGAVGGLFAGLGNAISRTGIVQDTLSLLTGAVRALGAVFPRTIEQVDGLTNRLPPLRDAAGHVRGAVDEMDEGLDEVGGAADGAAGGLGRAGEAAGKAKDKFEQATEAAKKLREQQDQLADAKTALAIEQINAAEQGGRITKADADRRRAQVRSDAEASKIGREVAEQDTIIEQQQKKQAEADGKVAAKRSGVGWAEADFEDTAKAAGIPLEQARATGERSEKENRDLFGDRANDLRGQATEARAGVETIENTGDADPKQLADQIALADALDKQAAAAARLKQAFDDLRESRNQEQLAAKASAETAKETGVAIADANARKEALGIQYQTATVKASTEQAKLRDDEEKKRLEERQKLLEHDLKSNALPGGQVAADQSEFTANQRRLNALTYKGDAAGLAVANATAPVPPGAEQNVKVREQLIKQIDDTLKDVPNLSPEQRTRLTGRRDVLAGLNAADAERGDSGALRDITEANRRREQGTADDKDTAGGAGIAGAARAISGDLAASGGGQPGTVSGNIQDLIAKLLAHGGKDDSAMAQLLPALTQYVDAQAGVGQRNAKLESDVADLKRRLQQLTTRLKNNP